LRYDLKIVAEHEFRVQHCLLAQKDTDIKEVKYALSHPQALSQCDNYLRQRGIKPIPVFDTAGAAKLVSSGKFTHKECTPKNTAAIASDLACKAYNLKFLEKGIEDDDSNYTRFLLLGRKGVVEYMNKSIPAKTSIVFTLPNSPGALYKAMACFSLRDIDFSKIESRPTSALLLQYLKFRTSHHTSSSDLKNSNIPRFRYTFYLDFLASELDEDSQNALHHLDEKATFCRVLGSYPAQSRLVGPLKEAVEHPNVLTSDELMKNMKYRDDSSTHVLNIGIVGFGTFGKFLAKTIQNYHHVSCTDSSDKSIEAESMNIDFYQNYDMSSFLENLDIVILAVPLIHFEKLLDSLPTQKLSNKLIVEVCPLSNHPKQLLLSKLSLNTDILCANCLFGPRTNNLQSGWDGLPVIFDKVRISDFHRYNSFLDIFKKERCHIVEMKAEQSDLIVGDSEFITHLTGRLLDRYSLSTLPVVSKEYAALLDLVEITSQFSFDTFFGLYQYCPNSKATLEKMRDNLAKIEKQLVAKEAYLAAKTEMQHANRNNLIDECRMLLHEAIKGEKQPNPQNTLFGVPKTMKTILTLDKQKSNN